MKERLSGWQAMQDTFQKEVLAGHQNPRDVMDQFFSEVMEVEEELLNPADEGYKQRLINELTDVLIITIGAISMLGGNVEEQVDEQIMNQFQKYAPFKSLIEQGLTPIEAKRKIKE